jgi:hypothetical protein
MHSARHLHSGIALATAAIAAAFILSPSSLFASTDGTFDRSLNVNGAVTLNVATGSGHIRITPASDNRVHIIGHVHAGHGLFDNGSAEEAVKRICDNPPIEQVGSIIRVGHQSQNRDWFHNVSIDYDITTPKGTDLEASSGSGDVRVDDLAGPAKLNSGSGSIEASGLSGRIILSTGSGDIRASMTMTTEVKAETGSGSIRLNGVQGALKAQTGSGDIEVQGQPTSPWKLGTGSGSVTLSTGGAHFTLDASTGSGSVHSDPPLTTHGSLEKHHVEGEINGGGPIVRVETGSGDVRIH